MQIILIIFIKPVIKDLESHKAYDEQYYKIGIGFIMHKINHIRDLFCGWSSNPCCKESFHLSDTD